jgi:hypothetical protein
MWPKKLSHDGPIAIRRRSVVKRKNPTNHILIYRNAESQCDLLGNARTSPSRVALLHIDNRLNDVRVWTLLAQVSPQRLGENKSRYFR